VRGARRRFAAALAIAGGLAIGGCAASHPPAGPADARLETGVASYYGDEFEGRRMASGERYDPQQLVAAHRSLPFGTRVRVINLANGRDVVVTVLDRGPFVKGRIVDVSRRAADQLDFIRAGTARVSLEPLGR